MMLPSSSSHCSSSSTTAAAATTGHQLSAGVQRSSLSASIRSGASTEQQQHRRLAAVRCRCSSSSSKCEPGPDASGSEPWALMGRVVHSERLELGDTSRQRLVVLAAARHAGVTPQFMAAALEELAHLLPDLASLLPRLSPALLAPLASDTAAVAHKLIRLRLLFPGADVGRMISRRPMLLLDDQFDQVETARAKLLARLAGPCHPAAAGVKQQPSGASAGQPPLQQQQPSGASASPPQPPPEQRAGAAQLPVTQSCPVLDALVSQQPLLLVAHVDELLDELERLLPSTRAMAALQRDPELLTSVLRTQNLSLCLMPGVAVLPLLQRNPSLLLSVQRGSRDLGPGAEFMGPG